MRKRTRKTPKPEQYNFQATDRRGSTGRGTGMDRPEIVEAMIKKAEKVAQKHGMNLKVTRSTGNTSVNVFGSDPEAWERIFKNKRKKGKDK